MIDKNQIVKYYESGMSAIQIAEVMKCDSTTVRKYLKALVSSYMKNDEWRLDIILQNNPERFAEIKQEYLDIPIPNFLAKYKVAYYKVTAIFGKKPYGKKWKYNKFHKENSIERKKKRESDTKLAPIIIKLEDKPVLPVPQEASIKLPFSTFTNCNSK